MGLYRLFTAPPPHLMQSELQVWLPCVCVCVCVCARTRVCAPRHSLPGGGTQKPAKVPNMRVTGGSSGVLLCIVLSGELEHS